ncbi:MAG: hypothetical protein N2B06_04790 [Clostridium sp.]
MPYIKQERREYFNEFNNDFNTLNEGELNYELTRLILKFEELNGTSYRSYNSIMGALEGCKLEFYRRRVQVYEDKKIEENGDVYIEKNKGCYNSSSYIDGLDYCGNCCGICNYCRKVTVEEPVVEDGGILGFFKKFFKKKQ